MLLDDVLAGLRDVRDGKVAMTSEQADVTLDAIYLLTEKQKVTEEKLAYYKKLEAEGRLKVLPPVEGEKCGTCGHYEVYNKTAYGLCGVRKRKPQEQLHVGRSRRACKDYQKKE